MTTTAFCYPRLHAQSMYQRLWWLLNSARGRRCTLLDVRSAATVEARLPNVWVHKPPWVRDPSRGTRLRERQHFFDLPLVPHKPEHPSADKKQAHCPRESETEGTDLSGATGCDWVDSYFAWLELSVVGLLLDHATPAGCFASSRAGVPTTPTT